MESQPFGIKSAKFLQRQLAAVQRYGVDEKRAHDRVVLASGIDRKEVGAHLKMAIQRHTKMKATEPKKTVM